MTDKKEVADQLWNEIKDLPIEMFSLPNQRVLNHVTRKGGTPDSVVLSLNSPAVLPSLEATLNAQKQYRDKVSRAMKAEGENVTDTYPKYEMEEAEGYVVVRRHVPATDRPELQDRPAYFIADKEEK
ncbi:MAG: hypothetical protein CMB80_25590 [Flammeovirgaceae bacterium]|nr:hypothetical protein [Flammeovirgaceae bacterium]